MKTTLKIKLMPTETQRQALLKTMEQFNNACNEISQFAFNQKCFGKFNIQKQVYHDIKSKYGLSAQMVIRAISKVAESYKADKKTLHQFKEHGAIVYDQRILSYKGLSHVSIWTIEKRQKVAMVLGDYQKARVDRIKGQADLILVKGVFFLLATLDLPEPPTTSPQKFLGVDLGIINIATTSEGEQFSGKQVDQIREKYSQLRKTLQSTGTKSAKRKLKKIAKKEQRFRRDVNHCISKTLVEKAKHTSQGIVLEHLKGIRERIRVRKSQRSRHHGWSFYQLQQFICYKAILAGVIVQLVVPRK
jgi:IS605 OrfB family transposase